MITLPTTIRNRATFRILYMAGDQWTAAAGQPWQVLPVPAIFDRTSATPGTLLTGTVKQGGYHVERITRWCLPDEDRASFYIDTGLVNGVRVTALDLSGFSTESPGIAVRIQVYDDENFPNGVSGSLPTGSGSSWKTVFAGYVISQQNSVAMGANIAGRTTYHCAGILSRTRYWPLDRHSTAAAPNAKGHPGYNIPLHGYFRKALGNYDYTNSPAADPFGDMGGENGYPDIGAYYAAHKLPLDGLTTAVQFSDADVVRHALASSRATGEPLIQTNLPTDLFGGNYAWSVSPGDSCLDILNRICNRQRGRGSCFVTYTDAVDPGGNLGITLTSFPSFPAVDGLVGITYTYNTAAQYGSLNLATTGTINGATLGNSAVNVDVNGDHRVHGHVEWEDRTSSVFDMIVVQGEPIQVCCNLNFFGSSLERRWSDTDAATFDGISATAIFELTSPRWRQVYRRFGVPSLTTWNFTVKAAPSSSAVTVNYYCDNQGSIQTDAVAGTTNAVNSVMTVRVLPDLPIYEGWNYAAAVPVRFDGGVDYLPPDRMSPVILYRGATDAGTSPAWLPLQYAGFQVSPDDFGMLITHPLEDQYGVRLLVPTPGSNRFKQMEKSINTTVLADVDTTGGVDFNKLNLIVGIELGTRSQLAIGGGTAGNYNALGRRMVMTVDGAHLWLGAPGGIFEMDYTKAAQGNYAPGLTFVAGSPAILRDDRNMLSFVASLAYYYYGTIHNPGTWSLTDCGLLTEFMTAENSTVPYPTLGQFVGTLTYGGVLGAESVATLNTPITCVDYDHGLGITTWRTDYVRYDGNIQ